MIEHEQEHESGDETLIKRAYLLKHATYMHVKVCEWVQEFSKYLWGIWAWR